MAAIKIEVTLDRSKIPGEARQIKNALQTELGNVGADAGRAIGSALSLNTGIGLKQIGEQARRTGTALTLGLTTPVLGLGAAVVKVGFDFEKSMNDLGAATKANNEQLAAATKLAKELGNDLSLPAISANDAAEAMTTLAKAGLGLDGAMGAVKGTLQLASAAGIDAAKAAEIQSDALNTFKLAASDAGRVADLLAASANSTSGEITDVADALKQTGAAAAILKIPIEDTVTALGLLAQNGVRGSDAGTSLKSALIQLTNPTKKAQAVMQKLGLEFFDSTGKLKPLRDLVDEYTTKTANLTDQQKLQTATTLAGTDGQRALNLVLGAGVEQYDKLKKSTTEAGAAQALAAAKAKGGVGAWEAFKSAMETLALSIFDVIKGPLISLLQSLNSVIQVLNDLPQGAQSAIVVFAGLAAAVGPLLVVLGSVVGAVTSLAGLFGVTLTVSLGAVAAAILPVTAALAALIGIGAALYAAWQSNFIGIRDAVESAFLDISSFASAELTKVQALFADILPQLRTLTATALDAMKTFWANHGAQIVSIIKTYWDSVKTIVSGAITIIGNTIKLILAVINGDWNAAWDALKTIVSTAISATIRLIQNAGSIIGQAVKFLGSVIINALIAIPKKTIEIGTNIVAGIVQGISSAAGSVYNKVKEISLGIISTARAALRIQSPSKESEILGVFWGEGFIAGLEKTRDLVYNAIKKTITNNLTAARDQIKALTVEIGAMLGATPKQFEASRQIEQLEQMKTKLAEILSIQKELGQQPGFADVTNLGVDSALAKARADRRIASGAKSVFALNAQDVSLAGSFGDQIKAAEDLDGKLAELAGQFQITTSAASNYDRAVAALNSSLANASEEDKNYILSIARQKDAYELANKQAETAKANIQKITDTFNQAFRDGFEKGPAAFFSRIFQAGKETFQRMAANALATLTTTILGGFLNKLGGLFGGGGTGGASSAGGGGFSLGGILQKFLGGGASSGNASSGGFLQKILGIGGTAGFSGGAGGFSASFAKDIGLDKIAASASISKAASAAAFSSKFTSDLGFSQFVPSGGLFNSFLSQFKGTAGKANLASLGGALPLLGLSIGSSLGGKSGLGQILGGIGGLALGGVGAAATGALSGLGIANFAALGALGPAALVAAPLLIAGAVLLGKAKQRKSDEAASGDMLTDALNKMDALKKGVESNQITGTVESIRQQFENEVIDVFKAQISTLKTASVRNSRLTNQVRDLRAKFEAEIVPLILAQQKGLKNQSNILPEFASGGLVPGVDRGFDSVLALLRPREVVLNLEQQAAIRAIAGADIFNRAGVPGMGQGVPPGSVQAFAGGGTVQPIRQGNDSPPIVLEFNPSFSIGTEDQTKILAGALSTPDGRKVLVRTTNNEKRFTGGN